MTDRRRHDSESPALARELDDPNGIWIHHAEDEPMERESYGLTDYARSTARELDDMIVAAGGPRDTHLGSFQPSVDYAVAGKFMRAQSLLAEVQVELLQADVELTDLRAFKSRVARIVAEFVRQQWSVSSLQPFFALNDELNPKGEA